MKICQIMKNKMMMLVTKRRRFASLEGFLKNSCASLTTLYLTVFILASENVLK